MKQEAFAQFRNTRLTFGGNLLNANTNPKIARPLSTKLPIHIVLRSAKSWMRAYKHFAKVNSTVAQVSQRHGVRLYEYANVGNHLHLLVRLPSRPRWAAFIRELTGRLASSGKTAWVGRPFTRVVNGWRKAYSSVKEYVRLNAFEAAHGLDRETARVLRDLGSRWRAGVP